MRVVREEQNLMVIEDRNILAFLIGLLFAVAGVLAIFKPDFFANQLPSWSGFAGVLFGSFTILVAKATTISLDKTSNKLLFLRKSLTSKSVKEFNLGQIKEVELSVAYSSSSEGSGHSYHLAFVLNNGEIVPLSPGSSSIVRIMGRQIIPERALGVRIANFLNVPFQERRPATVRETLSAVSSAIKSAAEKKMDK